MSTQSFRLRAIFMPEYRGKGVTMSAYYEMLDLSFMGCKYFVHVCSGEDGNYFIGDYLVLDENDALGFISALHAHGLDFAINEYGAHKMSESNWEQYDSMILAIAR